MKTKGKSIFFICLAMIVSGVILFSVIYSGQMVSAAQRVETYKDNGEDESEMTQESIQSQEKTVGEQAEYMEELEEEQNIAHSEILEVMGVRNALAVKMNTIERALQTMTLTKSPQKMFAAYYADGTFNGQESVLYLNQEVVWCLEPSELVGNVGKGITYALADPGDAAQWLQNRYGWSWNKINNLAKAVCFAKQYFGDHGLCGYALVQDLIWSEIQPYEDAGETGYYLLTNGAGNTTYQCEHLNTREKVNEAIQAVWQQFYAYNTLPSYQGKTISVMPGQTCWIPDTNGVTDKTSFIVPDGVQVIPGWHENHGGIWLKADESLAGRTATVNLYKNEIPAGTEGILVYGATDKKRQSVGMWSGAISPTYGCFRIICERDAYLNARYEARDAVAPSIDLHIQKTDAQTGKNLAGAVFEISMDGQKVASVVTDAEGKAAYHWRGEVLYTSYYESVQPVNMFSDWKSAYEAARRDVKQQVQDAVTQLKSATTHIWRVEEVQAPEGYARNEEVWEQTFDLNTLAVEAQYTNVPENGYLKLQKVSGNPEITKHNPCYSLEGAEYGVYQCLEDAQKDVGRIVTLKTDATGASDMQTICAGIYYIKEVTASLGYQYCAEQTEIGLPEGIHRVTVKSEETTEVRCVEEPAGKTLLLNLQKYEQEHEMTVGPGTASLQGAVFALEYYATTDPLHDNMPPVRTWYYQTDNNGQIYSTGEAYLVPELTESDGSVLCSDELYREKNGNVFYPIGTYRIREISAPKYFKLEGNMHFVENTDVCPDVKTGLDAVLRQPYSGASAELYAMGKKSHGEILIQNLSVHAYDKLHYGSITLYKTTADGKKRPLSGVEFHMTGQTDQDTYTAVSDENGKVVWDHLAPQVYVITEVKTAEGKNLLQDSIEVKLPMEMNLEDLVKNGQKEEDAVYDVMTGKYCFYDLTYRIGNTAILEMPFTGRRGWKVYGVLICGLVLLAAGIVFQRHKSI